jgi:hypothetical protein
MEEHMLNGEQFRAELEADADLMSRGWHAKYIGDGAVQRARLWARVGAEAIDHPDASKASRYLSAATVNLLEQHALILQAIIWRSAGHLRWPVWISTLALLWIAFVSTVGLLVLMTKP